MSLLTYFILSLLIKRNTALPYYFRLLSMRIKRNNFRMKSEVVQLDYVSPWKAPPESARNALEILLTKTKIL